MAPAPRIDVPPLDSTKAFALCDELGVSFPLAQVLARRGLDHPELARAWIAADDRHDVAEFRGIAEVAALVLGHIAAGTRITVHGDYDVDGVTSTAILLRTLRLLGASVDSYLPSRTEDGYGLNRATVDRLAERGTGLLITADCGITSVDEVAHARAAGIDVVVTDHHTPRADGRLPHAPIVHPVVCGYPCHDLCAAGVAYKAAGALLGAGGLDPALADLDLDLVALATIADCVPLRGENRRLVREGLRALSTTTRPGLRALMRVGQVDPSRVDARAVGFRLAPRINAAGRLQRADAGLELLLTEDPDRADQIALELDAINGDRKHVEQRMLFEAEAQVAELGERPAYVLWGEDWHPGVIGIVASRIAERTCRPAVLVALDGDQGTGSGRSIPAFDLLGGLDACARHLLRHGGHRAAAGCTVERAELDAFRAAFEAHAAAVLQPEDYVPVERVDAIVSGTELGTELAEELLSLAPFGTANPGVSLLVPAARLVDPRPMGEGKHLRFTVEAGGVRARAVAFGMSRLPEPAADGAPVDATFTLELNEWGGAVEPRLVLRQACPPAGAAAELAGEPEPGSAEWRFAVLHGLPAAAPVAEPEAVFAPRDRRGAGVAGTVAALVHTGEPVLVVCADAVARRGHLAGRMGGFTLASYEALERDPGLAGPFRHVVALDPPLVAGHELALRAASAGRMAHLAWGDPELQFSRHVLHRDHALRPALVDLFRALRGHELPVALDGRGVVVAARLAAVLRELGLVDADGRLVDGAPRTELERSSTFRWAAQRLAEAEPWLSRESATAHAA